MGDDLINHPPEQALNITEKRIMNINVFGVKPKDAIFNPNTPFAVRFNCQAGKLALSENDYISDNAEISIIKASRFYGSLGKTRNVEWLQLFYVAAPDCDVLPQNTVCVSYIKTRSLGQFQQVVIRLLGEGTNPAEGIFKVSFVPHSNELGNYFSVRFDWRKRVTRKDVNEFNQLEMIAEFLNDSPRLVDVTATREMVCIENLSQEEIDALMMDRAQLPEAR